MRIQNNLNKIFGKKKDYYILKDFNLLLPKQIREEHKILFQKFLISGKQNKINKINFDIFNIN